MRPSLIFSADSTPLLKRPFITSKVIRGSLGVASFSRDCSRNYVSKYRVALILGHYEYGTKASNKCINSTLTEYTSPEPL